MPITPLKTRYAQLATALLSSGIAFFSLLPGSVAISSGWSDKIEHSLAFAVLALLGRFGWPRTSAVKIFVLCVVYGGLIELGQSLSPGRHPDIWDLMADALGAGAGLLIALILSKKWH